MHSHNMVQTFLSVSLLSQAFQFTFYTVKINIGLRCREQIDFHPTKRALAITTTTNNPDYEQLIILM